MTVYEAFCGIGGFSLGFKRAGFEIIGGCEIDPYARAVYKKNFGIEPDGDIRAIKHVPADIVCGGFPCQPFSVAGTRRATEDDRHLWPEMLRLVESSKPRWVVGENVPGIGGYVDTICKDLEALGYEVLPLCIPASAFGAPHVRNRVWFIAHDQRKRVYIECRGSRRESREGASEFNGDGEKGNVADAQGVGSESGGSGRGPQEYAWTDMGCNERTPWKIEPSVGRVADGVPFRAHRLRCLGNAIVPQIAEWIAERIKEVEERNA